VASIDGLSSDYLRCYKRQRLPALQSLIGGGVASMQARQGLVDWFDHCTRLSQDWGVSAPSGGAEVQQSEARPAPLVPLGLRQLGADVPRGGGLLLGCVQRPHLVVAGPGCHRGRKDSAGLTPRLRCGIYYIFR